MTMKELTLVKNPVCKQLGKAFIYYNTMIPFEDMNDVTLERNPLHVKSVIKPSQFLTLS